MNVLVLNAGSSSLKGTLMSCTGATLAQGHADWASSPTRYRFVTATDENRTEETAWRGHGAATGRLIEDLAEDRGGEAELRSSLLVVGHRVVHGGSFRSSVEITDASLRSIRELAELAPLHNAGAAEAIDAARSRIPDVPHVAAFDTAFHSTLSPEAYVYPVPREWESRWGVRRYGFHGLSHAYCARRAAELLDRSVEGLRTIVLHLGHGCSASAIQGGRCLDTSMGFTPLEGLMMASRSGSIDPSIVLHLQRRAGLSLDQVDRALNFESGLAGVSGLSGDIRIVLQAAKNGHDRAQLAVAIYVRRIRQTIGAYAATLGGFDALVFAAGVGENSPEIRASACEGLRFFGVEIDPARNAENQPDTDVSSADSRVRVLVVKTREDLEMLRELGPWLDGSRRASVDAASEEPA
jgi:acetate kinase